MSDASDADRLEQELTVLPDTEPILPSSLEPEVPEADALEQALPAPLDEDEEHR